MTAEVLFAGIAVSELDAASAWYRALFDRAPDVIVNDDEAMWRVTTTGWVYLLRDPDRAGQSFVTVAVDDLDQHVAALAARGVRGAPIEAVGDAGRKARLTDPDGNEIAFIEVADRPAEEGGTV